MGTIFHGTRVRLIGTSVLGFSLACSQVEPAIDGVRQRVVESGEGDSTDGPHLGVIIGAGANPLLTNMSRHIRDRLDPDAVRATYKDRAGGLVDCVEILKQPALRRPEMAGKEFKKRPTYHTGQGPRLPPQLPARERARARFTPLYDLLVDTNTGVLPASGERQCPEGTVPITRISVEDIQRFTALDESLKRTKGIRFPEFPGQGSTAGHQYAHAYQYVENWGAFHAVNIWNADVQGNEFNDSQLWIWGGDGNDGTLQTIESGAMEYQGLGAGVRFFIFSITDYNGGVACWNGWCNDFVQVSSTLYPNMVYANESSPGLPNQIEDYPFWYKDGESGDWWLASGFYWNSIEWIGYYPRSNFATSGLANHALGIDFGGEITNAETNGLHTATDMGSGEFPTAGLGYAAYQAYIQYSANANQTSWPDATNLTRKPPTDANCYDVIYDNSLSDPYYQAFVIFGGPGYDAVNCY